MLPCMRVILFIATFAGQASHAIEVYQQSPTKVEVVDKGAIAALLVQRAAALAQFGQKTIDKPTGCCQKLKYIQRE